MRLLVVSNRLPITVVIKDGKLRFKESVGGLVSGLSAYLDSLKSASFTRSEYVWVGWPGITVNESMKEPLMSKAFSEFHAYPVFLSEKVMDKFYHGFCNKTIWPLFHYFPSYVVYDADYWIHYKRVNEMFRDVVMQIARPDDVIWIHDYHLMLLPKLIREQRPDAPIGFFLHIPFPSFEVFRLLPSKWRTEILEGLLGADLIGFHTHDYTHYFLRCVLRIMGYEHNMGQIAVQDRVIQVDTFPMGIDFQRFQTMARSPEVQAEKAKLKQFLADAKVILSIDRLDYSKGILNRLQAYEIFLEKNPQWWKKVVLILIVVPSRVGVEHYQLMKRQIDELVGKINGRFGTLDWTPISYQYRFLSFHHLLAVYMVSHVALVTPLRDGMNLIAKEYIASSLDQTGVLILSEMAGAARELGEAVIINPNNAEEIVDALQEALEMPIEEQVRRNRVMQDRLKRFDVVWWADEFIRALLDSKNEQQRTKAKLLGSRGGEQLVQDFYKARQRLLLLDYDGTLVPFAGHPQLAQPTGKLLEILKCLSAHPKTEVVLLSGRDKETLQSWFGMLNIGMVAEHGAWIKENEAWRTTRVLANDWKPRIRPILERYTHRLPGSFVEEKEFSLTWHYRQAEPEVGSIRAKELLDDLVRFTANIEVQVLQGNKVIEVRNAGVNKGAAALHFISHYNPDFILAIGDDWTDEDLFRVLPETAYSIKVGMTQSCARFNLHDQAEVVDLLQKLTLKVGYE